METGLPGKVVIVTGATANIGRAIALAFGQERTRVAVVGRDRAKGEEIAALVIEAGALDAQFFACDALDRSAVVKMVADVVDRFGPPDILVNNVGGNTTSFQLFSNTDPDGWQAEVDLNLTTTLSCTHAVLPHMLSRQSGRIINIGSTAGEVGDYMLSVYSALKGAVHAFTRVLALEVGEQGITVNCVAPYATFPDEPDHVSSGSRFAPDGAFANDENLKRPELKEKLLRRGVMARNHAKPSEIAAATVYFASEGAAFVTGRIHCVEGGALL